MNYSIEIISSHDFFSNKQYYNIYKNLYITKVSEPTIIKNYKLLREMHKESNDFKIILIKLNNQIKILAALIFKDENMSCIIDELVAEDCLDAEIFNFLLNNVYKIAKEMDYTNILTFTLEDDMYKFYLEEGFQTIQQISESDVKAVLKQI